MPAATLRLYFQPLCQHEVFRLISTLNAGSLCSRHISYGNTINVFYFFGKKAKLNQYKRSKQTCHMLHHACSIFKSNLIIP